MNHKARIVKRLDELRLPSKPYPNDRYNKGVEDATDTILDYMNQHEQMFLELKAHQDFLEEKAPEYTRDLQDQFDKFRNSFVNFQDLMSFPQETVEK